MATVAIERKGSQIRARYIAAALALLPVLAHLYVAVARSPLANYYVTVDEFAAKNTAGARGVRVGGPVAPGSIQYNNATRTFNFQLQGDARVLNVTYRGVAPDTFRDGATVIAEGDVNRDGGFVAASLLVKCPHEYVNAP